LYTAQKATVTMRPDPLRELNRFSDP